MRRQDVYAAIDSERDYQDAVFHDPNGGPHQHEVGTYLCFMEHYLSLARQELTTGKDRNKPLPFGALEQMRKVVALGVACFEQHSVPLRSSPRFRRVEK